MQILSNSENGKIKIDCSENNFMAMLYITKGLIADMREFLDTEDATNNDCGILEYIENLENDCRNIESLIEDIIPDDDAKKYYENITTAEAEK